ncbi:hypothetical protein [Nocardioides sp.]|uniref:hypothetical protein n=1 Tax=Nocardioides sp. TaxID=35761 RepID=UPI0025FF1670|nr:hypothetical protein [Nocardioides sp.]
MSRVRIAQVLGVLAALSVLGTGGVAASQWAEDDDTRSGDAAQRPEPVTVRDQRTGATFEVPAGGWRVADPEVRVYYADDAGRATAVVRGPALYRSGYCEADPQDSNRAFVGFTRQGFDDWVDGVVDGRSTWSTGVAHETVRLADGTRGRLSWVGLALDRGGPCSAPGVEVAMVEAGGVRLVLLRDTTVDDELPHEQVEEILTSLRLGSSRPSLRSCAAARSGRSGRGPCAARGWRASASAARSGSGWGR